MYPNNGPKVPRKQDVYVITLAPTSITPNALNAAMPNVCPALVNNPIRIPMYYNTYRP